MITEGTVVKRIEGLLAQAVAPWCVQCRERMKENGHDSGGNQRFYCGGCHVSAGNRRGYGPRHRSVKEVRAIELFEQGHSLRQVCRMVDIHIMTAAKYRRAAQMVKCRCGRDIKHQGWCWWRYQQSPKRQEFMQRWHQDSAR